MAVAKALRALMYLTLILRASSIRRGLAAPVVVVVGAKARALAILDEQAVRILLALVLSVLPLRLRLLTGCGITAATTTAVPAACAYWWRRRWYMLGNMA